MSKVFHSISQNTMSVQEKLEELEQLVRQNFETLHVAMSISGRGSMFLHIWKPPSVLLTKCSLNFLPSFHVVASVNRQSLMNLRLITYHGKTVSEIGGSQAQPTSSEQLNFLKKFEEAALCAGIKTPKSGWKHKSDLDDIRKNYYIEPFENGMVLRSKKCHFAVFNALADSRKNVVCEECAGMSANQKSTESDKDRDSDDYENEYDNFAPPPQPSNVQNNTQQQGMNSWCQVAIKEEQKDYNIPQPDGSIRPLNPTPRNFNEFENTDEWGFVNKVIKDDPEGQTRTGITEQTPGFNYNQNNQTSGPAHPAGTIGAKKKVGPGRPRRGDIRDLPQTNFEKGFEEQCKICLRVYKRRDKFEEDQRAHMDQFNFDESCTCPTCKCHIPRKWDLNPHYKNVHPEMNAGCCPVCLAILPPKQLRHHFHARHPPKSHLCSQCGQSFYSPSELSVHIACKHEAGGNHVCEQCGKVFHHKSRLNSHIFKAHRPTSSTPCNICGRLFNSRAMAISHNRTVHMGARPFKCRHCDYVASAKSKVYIHCERHYGRGRRGTKVDVEIVQDEWERIKEIEKRQGSIECKICNKVFSHGMVLCIHMKDNSKKWETANCPLCNKECQNMGVLNTHLLAIHIKAKPYKCRLCDFVTGRRSYALGHLEKRHEIQNDDGTHIEIITHEMNKVKTLQECNADLETIKRLLPPPDMPRPKFDPDDIKKEHGDNAAVPSAPAKIIDGKYQPYKCRNCDFRTYKKANIYVHCERKHGYKGNIKDVVLVGEEMPGQFICSSCGRSCMTFSALLYHHMVHLKLKPFKCRHCCMLTSRKANLYSHCEKNHGHKGTDADIIVDEQEFFKMTQLRESLLDEQKTSGTQLLKQHSSPHVEYKCSYCNFVANTRFEVQRHSNETHELNVNDFATMELPPKTPKNMYKCFKCPKEFKKRQPYILHLTVHFRIKPYKCAHCDHTTGRKAYISMHAQTAHGAPGTENDVVTLPEEEAKIQKLRDRLNEVYNPIITRPDEDGDEGGNDEDEGVGEEANNGGQEINKTGQPSKFMAFDPSTELDTERKQSNHNDDNQQNNTDIDMDTADDEDDIESEDVDTADSDMNDLTEDSKDNIKLPTISSSAQNVNRQTNNTLTSTNSSISPQYQFQTHSQPITTISNHATSSHHTPMLGNHEMVATSNSNHLSGQTSISSTQHQNTHLSHQPQLHLPHPVPTHNMQQESNHHLLASNQPHPQHPNILHPGLSTHHSNPTSNNSIQPQMQSHLNSTTTPHILGGNLMRPPKEEEANPLSSSMLDEFEQQMNQYQQQH